MKKLLLILLIPMIGFGQTLIPDANFEQALINLGYDTGTPNGSVPTANINAVTYLDVESQNIADLTGIEDFTVLTYLNCIGNQLTSLDVSTNTTLDSLNFGANQLTSLDVSQNTALTFLHCGLNNLTSLDVSTNTALTFLNCGYNQLTSLDVSTNTALTALGCELNNLTILDVSQNTALTFLHCWDNQLSSFDVRNGNNTNITDFWATGNPNLSCINVDDSTWSTNNWGAFIDLQHYFSNNCSGTTVIQEHSTNKELLKITDLLGRDAEKKRNTPLFYIYDDGTVEKRIVIE